MVAGIQGCLYEVVAGRSFLSFTVFGGKFDTEAIIENILPFFKLFMR